MKIKLKNWLSVDVDGTLRIHAVQPNKYNLGNGLFVWNAEGYSHPLTHSWHDTYKLMDKVTAGDLTKTPRKVTLILTDHKEEPL